MLILNEHSGDPALCYARAQIPKNNGLAKAKPFAARILSPPVMRQQDFALRWLFFFDQELLQRIA